MQPSKLAKRAWLLLFLVIVAFYLCGLGHLPFVGPDEPRYAEVAREMYLRHTLVTPTLGGHLWFEKPALLYWMMIASFAAFGVSEWAARLGPAISGLLTIAAVYWIGRRVELKSATTDGRLGILSAVVAASSGGMIVFSRGASFDIVVTMTITIALGFFLAAEIDTDNKHCRWLSGFYFFVGVSLLAKGLVGIVIPFGVVFAYYLMRRRWPRRELRFSLIWGLPLALVVAAVWYAPVIARNGWPFIDQFFIQHHFARFVSNKYHHPQPFYFYLPIILVLSLPWTPFLIDALAGARRWQWRSDDAEDKFRVFALAWFVLPIVFFSFSGSKLPAYILPSLPAAALLAGARLERFIRGEKVSWPMWAVIAILLLVAVGSIVYAERLGNISLRCALVIAAPLILAGLVAVVGRRKRILAAVLIALAVLFATQLALFCAADKFALRESVRDLIQLAAARGYGTAPIFALHQIERTAEFYAAGRVAYGSDGEPVRFESAYEVAKQARQSRGPILVVVPVDYTWQLTTFKGIQAEIIGNNGRAAVVVVRAEGP